MKVGLSIAADTSRMSVPGTVGLRVMILSVLAFLAASNPAFAASMQQTVADSAGIVRDFTRLPEHGIPARVLRNAKGVAVLRVLKGGFGVSGRLGEGVVLARLSSGGWSGPAAIATGGSRRSAAPAAPSRRPFGIRGGRSFVEHKLARSLAD
jgi:hypothetical protein